MAKPKRKLLPKDFEAMLENGNLDELKAVFDTRLIDARGDYDKRPALAFDLCPDPLARWLVAQGADLYAANTYGDTPLHLRACSWRGRMEVLLELGADVNRPNASGATPLHEAVRCHRAESTRVLLAHGAKLDAVDANGLTPLELALTTCQNADLTEMLLIARALLAAGARTTGSMKDHVRSIGTRFEEFRAVFSPEHVDAFSAALDALYALFEVAPLARRVMHNGRSPISVAATDWESQHQELWDALVRPKGYAATVQGEVIRISGRIGRELDGNGGANWDSDYKRMADALLGHVQSGQPLPAPTLAEFAALVGAAKRQSCDTARLAELSVAWVLLNPQPVAMEKPAYRR
ncbi:hypothetical protein F2P45_12665 [Massilia sp. CCM 8733]|uniref:Ankyrin repeat domain-containing protein n=1 Tax=Massilia mucilaginosa TaxID=2609282 RepID=A0ABX0NSK5_9BURK|nr:ankyrin repeat domain-containing protein [Massilia mucilaginosa]NHZ89858.1 hypothetical protein [Massilia mucilaginosa]